MLSRELALDTPDPRPPVAQLAASTQELLCTVDGSQLTACLPYAFSRRPLDTCFAVVALVASYRKQYDRRWASSTYPHPSVGLALQPCSLLSRMPTVGGPSLRGSGP